MLDLISDLLLIFFSNKILNSTQSPVSTDYAHALFIHSLSLIRTPPFTASVAAAAAAALIIAQFNVQTCHTASVGRCGTAKSG